MTDITVPAGWQRALEIIHMDFPDAVIAGGALRDLILGREIKDIDVFAHANGNYDTPWTSAQLKGCMDHYLGPSKISINEAFAKACPAITGVVCAVEIWARYTLPNPVQLILTPFPVTLRSAVARIDFGLCRVAYDGKTLYRSPEFDYDAENKQFTLYRADNDRQYWRSQARWERFQAKYEGWPMDVTAEALKGATIPARTAFSY
jgi:hypothetical protein